MELKGTTAPGSAFLRHQLARAVAVLLLNSQCCGQTPEIFQGADLALGKKLMADSKCAECHQRKVGGDGSTIYRPDEKITTPGFLRGMVEQCNTQLNLGMFPDDVTAVAAVLNRDHYGFKK
jgi:hypothetical protein